MDVGIGGALLAVPLLAMLKIRLDQSERTKPMGTLLGGSAANCARTAEPIPSDNNCFPGMALSRRCACRLTAVGHGGSPPYGNAGGTDDTSRLQ